jgi:hypothetical protein
VTHRAEAASQKRAIAQLKEAPNRLELLLRWCPEKDAARVPPGEAESIRLVVTRLGTLDRHHWLAAVKRLSGSEDEPAAKDVAPAPEDLADSELSELVTRFRHVRAQATEFLEEIGGGDWERVAKVVAQWVDHDAAAFASLNTMCAELNRS